MIVLALVIFLILVLFFRLFGFGAIYLISQQNRQLAEGGYVPVSQINVIKNKLFFLEPDYARALNKLVGKDLKTIKYFDEIDEELEYKEHKEVARQIMHIGQLKLFLTELEFLTDSLKSYQEDAVVVYAGSA